MKSIKSKIEVTITKIHVQDDFFSFSYKITVNGKIHVNKGYYSDYYYNGMTVKKWTKKLEKDYAVQFAIQQEF